MGVGRRRTPKKGRAVTRDFVWRHCHTLKWAGMLSKAPTAVHLLDRIQAGWKDICFPLGQMKQNSGFLCCSLSWQEEKANLLLGYSPMGPQTSHKNWPACYFQGLCLRLPVQSDGPLGLKGWTTKLSSWMSPPAGGEEPHTRANASEAWREGCVWADRQLDRDVCGER